MVKAPKISSQGFTLIEVMVALVLFSLAALAALYVASQQLSSSSRIQEQYLAQWVASNQLAEVFLDVKAGRWPPTSETGEAKNAGQTWYWQQSVKETVTADLLEVTVAVRTQEQGRIVAELSVFVGRSS